MREGDLEVMLSYKGYTGKVEVDADSGMLSGCVLNLRDVVAYQMEFQSLKRILLDFGVNFSILLRKNPRLVAPRIESGLYHAFHSISVL
jgi:hypothetical protein